MINVEHNCKHIISRKKGSIDGHLTSLHIELCPRTKLVILHRLYFNEEPLNESALHLRTFFGKKLFLEETFFGLADIEMLLTMLTRNNVLQFQAILPQSLN